MPKRPPSPPRLASIRSPFPSVSWRKPSSTVFSSNPQPLFPPTSTVSSSSSSSPSPSISSSHMPSLEVPLTLPDMITPPHPSSSSSVGVKNMLIEADTSLLNTPSVLSEEALQVYSHLLPLTLLYLSPLSITPSSFFYIVSLFTYPVQALLTQKRGKMVASSEEAPPRPNETQGQQEAP